MTFFLFCSALFAILLLGVLMMAWVIKVKFGDTTATYPLYELRDRMIAGAVFDQLDRNDPWFVSLYENINLVLRHSNFVAGPGDGWRRAGKLGNLVAKQPKLAKPLEFPHYTPSPALEPIVQELYQRLLQLENNHAGLLIQRGTERSERRRRQREEAKKVRSQLDAAGVGAHLSLGC